MKLNVYQKTAIATIIATLFLILVGGLVRASGAGLGCPDWPKCFGLWIPPTDISELPPQFDESQFNVVKTWTEYVNRLIGVLIGFFILATFLLSIKYRKTKPSIFFSSLAALILVLFQAWLGGQVVRTGLQEGMITIHMIVAMIILSTLIFAAYRATQDLVKVEISPDLRKTLFWTMTVIFGLTIIQMILGTQVREAIDVIKNVPNPPERSTWIEESGYIFFVHRTFSWLFVGAAFYLLYILKKYRPTGTIKKLMDINLFLIVLQIAVGVGLAYLNMAGALQVIHLLGIALMICAQFFMILLLRKPVLES